jgi:hypothetical protein
VNPGRVIATLAAAAALVLCAPAAGAAANTWAGVWDTDFGDMTLDASGSGSYLGFTPGTIAGHVTGDVNEGTWHQPGNRNGTFKFTLSADGRSFTGEWAYDGGGCGSACGWSGACTAGACLQNEVPPPLTPRTVRPLLGATTSYKAPRPGKVAALPLPALRPKARSVSVAIGVIGVGGALEAPAVVGLEVTGTEEEENRYADSALRICHIFLIAPVRLGDQEFLACAYAVVTVLRRYDQIKARREAEASAARCRAIRFKGRKRKQAVKVGCKATATGVRLSFRRLPGRPPLSRLFGRKARLVVGRSRFDTAAATDRVDVTWLRR